MIERNIGRKVDGIATSEKAKLHIPLLTIVPISYIGANDVEVNFETNITVNETSIENKE